MQCNFQAKAIVGTLRGDGTVSLDTELPVPEPRRAPPQVNTAGIVVAVGVLGEEALARGRNHERALTGATAVTRPVIISWGRAAADVGDRSSASSESADGRVNTRRSALAQPT